MLKHMIQLTAFVATVGVAMLITGGVQASHVTLSADNELYPVVGNPLDLGLPLLQNELPEDYYDIARPPGDLPADPLADGAAITIFAYDHTSAGGQTVTALAPRNFGDTNCDDSRDDGSSKPCWAGNNKDVIFEFFAFGGGQSGPEPLIPAPFLRVTQGNTNTITLVNTSTALTHAIDFHAIVGLKGGAAVLAAGPNGTSDPIEFTWQDAGLSYTRKLVMA